MCRQVRQGSGPKHIAGLELDAQPVASAQRRLNGEDRVPAELDEVLAVPDLGVTEDVPPDRAKAGQLRVILIVRLPRRPVDM